MNKQLLLYFFLLPCIGLNAQRDADSLFQIWNNPDMSDSIRVAAMSECIREFYVAKNADSTQILSDNLKAFSEERGQRFGVANAIRFLGAAKFFEYKYSEAINLLNESLELSEEISYLPGMAYAARMIGTVYQRMNKEAKGLEYFEKSLSLLEEIKDSVNIPSVLMGIGSIQKRARNHDKAIEYFQRSYELYENKGDQYNIADALAQIASIYRRKENVEKSLELNMRAMEIRESIGAKLRVASSLNNIGNLYEDIKDYEQALGYHSRALEIRKKEGNIGGVASSLRNIGTIYLELRQHGKAIVNCKKSLDIYTQTKNINRQYRTCLCLYRAYKGLGDSKKTLEYLEEMLQYEDELAKEDNAKKLQQMAFDKLLEADSIAQAEEKKKIMLAHQTAIEKEEKNRNRAIGAFLIALLLATGFYARWRFVNKAKKEIQKERDRAENLLLNILPAEIAEELKEKGEAAARDFNQVSILFTDFKDFTKISEQLNAKALVDELNHCFKTFDGIITKYGLEKIKTIGDAYMAAGGLPAADALSAQKIVMAALEMSDFIVRRRSELLAENKLAFQMRAGIHTGPVVAGIVGVKKFQYDIWGDTVNTASRMESNGEVGKVNISAATYELLKNDPAFIFEERGMVEVKGKGEMAMYFVGRK